LEAAAFGAAASPSPRADISPDIPARKPNHHYRIREDSPQIVYWVKTGGGLLINLRQDPLPVKIVHVKGQQSLANASSWINLLSRVKLLTTNQRQSQTLVRSDHQQDAHLVYLSMVCSPVLIGSAL
jgi:hypothetical protein